MSPSTQDCLQSLGFTDSVLELPLSALALLLQVFEILWLYQSGSVSCFCLRDFTIAPLLTPSFLVCVCVCRSFFLCLTHHLSAVTIFHCLETQIHIFSIVNALTCLKNQSLLHRVGDQGSIIVIIRRRNKKTGRNSPHVKKKYRDIGEQCLETYCFEVHDFAVYMEQSPRQTLL